MKTDFDAKAAEWDTDPAKVERARMVAETIRSAVSPGLHTRAMEYGCGTGLLTFALRNDLGHATLADTSEGMLTVLREKIAARGIRNMTPVRLDLLSGSRPEEGYDLVYTLMVLHHIPDTAGILRAFHQVLNEGGHLCVADLDREDGSFHGPGFDGHNGFDREALAALAHETGFRKIEFSTVFRMPRDVGNEVREFPVFLMTARKER